MHSLIRNQAATAKIAQGGVGLYSYMGGVQPFPRNGVLGLYVWTAVRDYRSEIFSCRGSIAGNCDLDARGFFGAWGVGG